MSKVLVLTEAAVMHDLLELIRDCDADTLVALYCDAFGFSGGRFDPDLEAYEFDADGPNYAGQRKAQLVDKKDGVHASES